MGPRIDWKMTRLLSIPHSNVAGQAAARSSCPAHRIDQQHAVLWTTVLRRMCSPQLLPDTRSYSATVLKAKPGFPGTLFSATNMAGVFMRDFVVDGSGSASVCIDTSWPNTLGTTALNIYEGIIVQELLDQRLARYQ